MIYVSFKKKMIFIYKMKVRDFKIFLRDVLCMMFFKPINVFHLKKTLVKFVYVVGLFKKH